MAKSVSDENMKARYRKMRVNGKQVSVHRHILEQKLGRALRSDEVVHHINGNKLDNRPENLQVLKVGQHSRLENIGKHLTDEHKAKVSASLIGNQRRKGVPHSDADKKKISDGVKRIRATRYWASRGHKLSQLGQ